MTNGLIDTVQSTRNTNRPITPLISDIAGDSLLSLHLLPGDLAVCVHVTWSRSTSAHGRVAQGGPARGRCRKAYSGAV